jgi:soluble lytic murein transglycosylase
MRLFSTKAILRVLMFGIVLLKSPTTMAEQGESLTPLLKSRNLFQAAYTMYQTEDYQQAIPAFYQFIQEYPEHLLLDYAYLYLGMSLLKTSQYEEARKTVEQLQKAYPQSLLIADIEFLIADSYYLQAQYSIATQRYLALKNDKRYKKHRLLPELYLKLGHCYEQQKQDKDAREVYHQAQLTFLAIPTIYDVAKQREERLLTQYPSLQTSLTSETLLKDADKLIPSGKANDAVQMLTKLSQQKLSITLQQRMLLKLAQAYDAIRAYPQALTRYQLFLKQFPTSQAVPYALERIGRLYLKQQDMAAFLKIYTQLLVKYPKHRSTAEIIRLQGGELEHQGKFKEALAEYTKWMQFFPKNPSATEILWHTGWSHYQLQHYESALKALSQLVQKHPKSAYREEACYWAGQAAEQVQKYTLAGDYYLKNINSNRNSYYGFLSQQAFTQLSQNHPDLKFSQKLTALKPLPFVDQPKYTAPQAILHRKKAQELAQLTLYPQAAEELAYAIKQDKPDETKYLELARLYQQAGDFHELYRLMRTHFLAWILRGDETLPQSFWELCYPLGFFQHIQQAAAAAEEPDPLLTIALVLAESTFDPAAYSPAGAMGLMQLMPATGAKMANVLKIPAPALDQYFQPELNILLGTTYLKELFTLFKGQLPLVIASYNAGEQVVSTWWKETYQDDEPAFVASIPYKETKQYVQKVLWYYREYQRIYR